MNTKSPKSNPKRKGTSVEKRLSVEDLLWWVILVLMVFITWVVTNNHSIKKDISHMNKQLIKLIEEQK